MRDYSKYPNTPWQYKAIGKSPFDKLGLLIHFDVPQENSPMPYTFIVNGNEELKKLAMHDPRVIEELSKELDAGFSPQYMNKEQTTFLKPISIPETRKLLFDYSIKLERN